MGCTSSSNADSPQERPHTVHVVENKEIDYAEILSKVSFRRKFVAQSLEEIWPDNPLQKFIDNHAILTFFHIPSIKRTSSTTVAKCYDPDLHCNSTNIFMCPYRWKLNEPSQDEFCHELPINEFRELRTLIQSWQDQGFSLRLVKKMPGSDKPQAQDMFPPDKSLHCVLQCVFQNCDLGIGYKILGMPWTHKFGKNGFLDYEFPDIAGELSYYGQMGFRICGIFGTLVQLPKEQKINARSRNRLHFILEKMPDRTYRFKQSIFTYHRKARDRNVELMGNIEDWIYRFTSRGWVLGATMKMPYQPDHLGCKIPELLVFQTDSEEVI